MILKEFMLFAFVSLSAAANLDRSDCPDDTSLLISAFNLENFGQKQMQRPQFREWLVEIIRRYDLIIIQEIRDTSGYFFQALVALVIEKDDRYNYFMSEPYGRSSHWSRSSRKERYGYIFRKESVLPLDCFDFPFDRPQDYRYENFPLFERQPYIFQFQCRKTACLGLIFNTIVLHAKYDGENAGSTVNEIRNLFQVYNYAKHRTGIADAVILGDLNADSPCVESDDWSDMALRDPNNFAWLIGDRESTTVSTDKAFDRIITAGGVTKDPNLAGVYNFGVALGLNYDQTAAVSNHFPVELCINNSPYQIQELQPQNLHCIMPLPSLEDLPGYVTASLNKDPSPPLRQPRSKLQLL